MKTLLVVAAAIFITGCASIVLDKRPLLSPFGDGAQWIVWEDMEFIVKLDNNSITSIRVPRGFVTDLASTPKLFWSIYPPFGKYLSASVLHDYLYWRQTCKKEEADEIFYQTMRDARVDQATQSRFFLALDKEGKSAWNQNYDERSRGLVRVIPDEILRSAELKRSAATTWDEFRELLYEQNVREQEQPSDANMAEACTLLAREVTVKTDFVSTVFGK